MEIGNLYFNIPKILPTEMVESLVNCKDVRIERIVSKGQCSEPDFWYDQEKYEWVLLVRGEAKLRFKQGNKVLHLTAGTYVNIAAHEKHRVEWTKEDSETIWLVVFY
jgi:cupin 2 domain-containing protein